MGIGLFEASPVLLLFLLGYCLAVIDGELRCYCNESGCVATGYMCKSSVGRCFTSIGGPGDGEDEGHRQMTHGCLDSLPPRHRVACKTAEVDVVSATAAVSVSGSPGSYSLQKVPLLLCCSEHMCNYIEDKADVGNGHNYPTKNNGTFHRGNTFSKKDQAVSSRNHGSNRDDDRDLWFKAAVIAVPIAGGFILVLLVLLAVRMLRTDSRYHRRLIQIRQERNFAKSHNMYISDQFVGKKHQCSLFNEKTGKICSILYPTDTPRPCPGVKSPTNPSFPSHTKNPPHRTGYIGLFGNRYSNKRKKLKDSGRSITTTPSSSIQHSCDNFSYSDYCSKNNESGCCKEHCGYSITSCSSSEKHVPVSTTNSLSGKEVFKDNDHKKVFDQKENSGKQETQHEDLSNVSLCVGENITSNQSDANV